MTATTFVRAGAGTPPTTDSATVTSLVAQLIAKIAAMAQPGIKKPRPRIVARCMTRVAPLRNGPGQRDVCARGGPGGDRIIHHGRGGVGPACARTAPNTSAL
jgi:hypothetical protein